MILVIVYIGAGLYMWLMLLGVLHKEYMKTLNRARKLGLGVMGTGFIFLGIATGYYYSPEWRAISGKHTEEQRALPADHGPSPQTDRAP